MRCTLVLCCLFCVAACDRPPESYPPPEQRHPVEGYNPGPDPMMVEMSEPDADLHIVKDIYGPSNPSWRWTFQNPTVKLMALSTENLKFYTDFTLWETAFQATGPLEVEFFVNGRSLDKVRYTTPGFKHFEKPVAPDWLSLDGYAILAISVDKLYVDPRNGMKFGVILSRIGFRQR